MELRYLDYRGKRVLYRAHVPILNVKYDQSCGPYRDWQNQEGMIQANGTTVAPGFILSPTPVQTLLDNRSDSGTFLGVGIYVQRLEVVLVSEMQASWYRYVSEWRLHADGTTRPRFGFSAVQSSCVCNDITIMPIGGSTSTSAHLEIMLYTSSMTHRSSRARTGTPRPSRFAARAIHRAIASGGLRTSRRAMSMTSPQAK